MSSQIESMARVAIAKANILCGVALLETAMMNPVNCSHAGRQYFG